MFGHRFPGRAVVAALLLLAATLAVAQARAQSSDPTVGGPAGALPTYLCSDLGSSYCYTTDAGGPIGSGGSAAVLPYMDNAARNWGCQWNLARNPTAPLGGGNWSKWYGTETDIDHGCGLVYWNYARQAAYFLPNSNRNGNVALGSRGATVSVSSTYSAGTPAGSLIDGNRRGNVWASGGGWSSLYNPTPSAPQWIRINLNASRTINEIVVTTLQDNYSSPIEPTPATTFANYGVRDYSVQYWNGSSWVVLGSVVANNRVLRRFTFAPVTTAFLRVNITAALQSYARVVEVEAYEKSTTATQLLGRYGSLGLHASILGFPISNPTPYGWAGATYQQFTRGIITYVSGSTSATHAGGVAPEDQALAAKYAEHFGVSPTSGPAIYGLVQEVDCTNVFGTGCSFGKNGRYLEWRDAYQGFNEMIIARTGWTTAVHVSGAIRNKWIEQYGVAPWNGALGFPVTDLRATGSATHHQEFEKGSIVLELSGCSAGPYVARIVPQFRRPIFDSNLTMLCEDAPPPNPELSLPSAPIRFSAGGRTGSYAFDSGRDATGWFRGASVTFDGAPALSVSGEFYSAWIGGAAGGGNVGDALAAQAPGSNWGEPASNATCVGNPCTRLQQTFTHGVATLPVGGLIGFTPIDPGLAAPTSFGPLDRGYTTPPPPADRRTPIEHRSDDYIKLIWRNQATLAGVTTRLYRSVTPLNGSPGPWTLIQTYPPPTLVKGTFTEFTDNAAANNAKNCYRLSVSLGGNTRNSETACGYTLDGTVGGGIDRSAPRGVSRAQVRITVPPDPFDSATLKSVGARLDSFAGGLDYNFTFLDSSGPDFFLDSSRNYDVLLTGIQDVSDIVGITISSYRDNLRVSRIDLRLNNVLAYTRTYDPPVLVSNSDLPGGRSLVVGFNELRSSPLWQDVYSTSPLAFTGFTPGDFIAKLDGILGHQVRNAPGAAYHNSRLLDGHFTRVTKRPGYLRDRLHVQQHVRATDRKGGANCTLDYDLRITAKDINGSSVSALFNGPAVPGSGQGIYTTEIKVENPNVSCSSTAFLLKYLLSEILRVTPFQSELSDLEKNIQASLKGQAPSQIQAAPPPNMHFCFPGSGESSFPPFRNGGLTVCDDE